MMVYISQKKERKKKTTTQPTNQPINTTSSRNKTEGRNTRRQARISYVRACTKPIERFKRPASHEPEPVVDRQFVAGWGPPVQGFVGFFFEYSKQTNDLLVINLIRALDCIGQRVWGGFGARVSLARALDGCVLAGRVLFWQCD